jgi:uncharacterized protein (DUF608 family)
LINYKKTATASPPVWSLASLYQLMNRLLGSRVSTSLLCAFPTREKAMVTSVMPCVKCEDGYIFSFYYQNVDAPNAPEEVKHLGQSHITGCRIIYLMQQSPNMWTRVYKDNLFNS